MIEVDISDDIISNAKIKADEMGSLNNSIRKGDGNLVGFIGEYVVADYLDGTINNTYDYDITHCNVRIDVKTKECTSPPKPYYECSIAGYNTKQQCDVYVFTRVCNRKCWILGWMLKEDYFKRAKFMKKGQIDTSNNFTVKADCYNLAISDLKSIEGLKKAFDKRLASL